MIPVKEAHKKFVEHLKTKSKSTYTVLAYGKDIEQLVDFLSELKKSHVQHVNHKDLKGFISKLEKENYTPKSVSRKINSTKTFFRFLKVNEYITDDPAVLLEHPKLENKPPRILSKLEYRALRDAARNDARISAVIELLLQTGVRIGELANLRLEDLTYSQGTKNGEIYVQPYQSQPERTVPLNKAAEVAVKKYLENRSNTKEKRVFVTKTGRPLLIRNIRTSIVRYFRIAGIKNAKVNDLRHTFVAHHLMSGTSLVIVSKLAGHKRVATTEKYLEFIKDQMNQPVKLDEL